MHELKKDLPQTRNTKIGLCRIFGSYSLRYRTVYSCSVE